MDETVNGEYRVTDTRKGGFLELGAVTLRDFNLKIVYIIVGRW
jgi:hypothetical protein